MQTTVLNKTCSQVNMPAVKILARDLGKRLAAAGSQTVWSEVTLVLTDDKGITQANREFFGKDHPTDVISFCCAPVPGEAGMTGDLLVNLECALREGPRRDGVNAELALYIAHGFNHLSGANDNTPARRAAMRRTEKRWLEELQEAVNNLI